MTLNSQRLGHSPLQINRSELPAAHQKVSKILNQAWKELKNRFHDQDVGFYDTPLNQKLSQIDACQQLARSLLEQKKFTDCLFLGIGGSSLGPISLLSSLPEKQTTGIRFHFLENPDPQDWKTTLQPLQPDQTLVCSVTKSGTTFETLAQTLLAIEWLGPSRFRQQLIALTDPEAGALRALVRKENLLSLEIPPSLGGRFCIFTSVGLFPAALAGLDTQKFLKGAQLIRDDLETSSLEIHPLLNLSFDLIQQFNRRPIHVCMPYSTRLKSWGSWFVQLWAESLGKQGLGFTPLAAVGATDQHSLLQILKEGPDDKITFFLKINHVDDPMDLPPLHWLPDVYQDFSFQILKNHSLHKLLEIEYHATALVLTRQQRPHLTFLLDQLDEQAMGSLYFAFAVLTAITGKLWNINPFDQPGVQEGKDYILKALRKTPIDH